MTPPLRYIKSPINYIGNKYKLLPDITPLFPKKIDTFIDLFGGSGTVLLNVYANKYIYNDINGYVADILEGIIDQNFDYIIQMVKETIKEYHLSKTNKEGFLKLRDDYNNGKNDWITLYTLMCYSFNYQLRFNNNHIYNSSFGANRSSFSRNQEKNIWLAQYKMLGTCKEFWRKNFKDINYKQFTSKDFIYIDPPYYNSTGNYNDGKRGFENWEYPQEHFLQTIMEDLTWHGVRWAMSNNISVNPEIRIWAEKNNYNINFFDMNYDNCNYQKKKTGSDREVLITNYDQETQKTIL